MGDTLDPYRPLYHFTPDSMWVNDPNGLVYVNGTYHLFTQYNPFANVWGHMSWGHAVSKDLLSWKQLPVAIPEYTSADSVTTMIFSGSAVVDSFNRSGFAKKKGVAPLVAIYTSNSIKKGIQISQNQSIAYSLDNGISWKQYANNPILDIGSKEFRDPKVFWYSKAKKWIMVVSKATLHVVQFYSSTNLKEWKYLSEFGSIGNIDRVWECPDLYPLPIKNSKQIKWVLSVSSGAGSDGKLAMQYFVGEFDGHQFIADKMSYPLYLNHGQDFYAGVTYNGIPQKDGRRIMVGWANCWNYAREIPTGNKWRGTYALPRELHLKKVDDNYVLVQEPIKEYDLLRKEVFSLNTQKVDSAINIPFAGSSYEMDVTIDPKFSSISGVKLLKSGNEETFIYYDSKSGELCVDRRNSGNTSFSNQFSSIEKAKVRMINGKIKLRILVDKSIVEVFANDGETAFTDLVFPLKNEGGIQLYSEKGESIFSSIKIFKIVEGKF